VVAILELPAPDDQLHAEMAPRGYRLLHRLPQLSPALVESLVDRFGTLPEIMSATVPELEAVHGIGNDTARLIRDGLARMVEASIFERYE
jgi:diadenylate cyclase